MAEEGKQKAEAEVGSASAAKTAAEADKKRTGNKHFH